MRKSLALTLSAGLLLALSACSTSTTAADCSTTVSPGDASELVSASGDLGTDPAATFPFPLVTDTTEASVLVKGSGDVAGDGGVVNVNYAVYDGESGAAVGEPQGGLIVVSDNLPEGLHDALTCAATGERVAVVLPNEVASTVVSGAPGTIVMVFDVSSVFPRAADGSDQPAQAGFPGVVHDADGRPGISIGSNTAPDEAKSALLKKGDGDKVSEGDAVLVQSTAVSYDTGEVTTSTWEDGAPALWLMSDDASATSGSTQPAGITEFLVGQTVGSEVIVVLPADADAGTSATAYVVDILGITPAA